MVERSFSTTEAARICGLPRLTLIGWDRSGFLSPAVAARGTGRGHGRGYSFRDLVRLRVARELRNEGVSLQRLRLVLKRLRAEQRDLADSRLVLSGRGRSQAVHLVEAGAELRDLLSGQAGFAFLLDLGPIVAAVTKAAARKAA